MRRAIAEVRYDLLGDRRHVGARHVGGQRAELGLGQRRVEAGEVLILGELLAHGRVRFDDQPPNSGALTLDDEPLYQRPAEDKILPPGGSHN